MSSTSAVSANASAASASASHAGLSVGGNKNFKIVGICLAVGSGLFIGSSYVVKKKGLLRATRKHGNATGEGHAYLKDWIWWTGMTMMVVGEVLNFVAYAFTEAILVTPMGALSVVICAILSHFFLKESLNFFGWIGCALCIIGATILALNAPEQQSVTTVHAFKHLFLSPGFLVWGSLSIAVSLVIVFFVAPKWGKRNMMPYIGVCSLIGGISVSCTQGLGASIVTSIQGNNQVKNWFFWFLFVFVVITLLTEINYLNKALELFNAAMVVPVYFVTFTSATLITSFILYQGLKASAITLVTMVLGFMVICLGITLLQMSKVDPKQLVKLDRKSTIFLEAAHRQTEESEKGNVTSLEEPGIDALRGGFGAVGSIIRARSISRKMSSASSTGGLGFNMENNLSTHGLGHLQRYQLSDNPMPNDAQDRILSHQRSPTDRGFSFSAQSAPTPKLSQSSLKFEEADVVHQYGYGREHESRHSVRPHSQSAPPVPIFSGRAGVQGPRPPPSSRQASGSSHYPPVVEEPEEMDEIAESEKGYPPQSEKGYLDPYSRPSNQRTTSNVSNASNHSATGRLASMFHLNTSTHASKGEVRGGQHRGTKDYPHLHKRDHELEHAEREALVDKEEDREWSTTHGHGHSRQVSGESDRYDEPRSAVTDESFGHVFRAERRAVGSREVEVDHRWDEMGRGSRI